MNKYPLILRLVSFLFLLLIPLSACGIKPMTLPSPEPVGKDTYITIVPNTDPAVTTSDEWIGGTKPVPDTITPQDTVTGGTIEEPGDETDEIPGTIGGPVTPPVDVVVNPSKLSELDPDLFGLFQFHSEPERVEGELASQMPENYFWDSYPENWMELEAEASAAVFWSYSDDPTDTAGKLYSTILSDLNYVEEHTVGFYYIQNKGTGGYITHLGVLPIVYDYEEYDYYSDRFDAYACARVPVLCNEKLTASHLSGAQIYRVVALEGGYYAFLYTTTAGYDQYAGSVYDALQQDRHQLINNVPLARSFWYSSWVVEETPSGAYRLTTRMSDYCTQFTPEYVGANTERLPYLGEYYAYSNRYLAVTKQTTHSLLNTRKYDMPTLYGGYTNDSDYSDEWLFIPVKGSPEFNP